MRDFKTRFKDFKLMDNSVFGKTFANLEQFDALTYASYLGH